MLKDCNTFWKSVCVKEELANYQCLVSDDEDDSVDNQSTEKRVKIGWRGKPMHIVPDANLPSWKRVFIKVRNNEDINLGKSQVCNPL